MWHLTPIPLHRPPPPPDAIQSCMSRAFIHGYRLRLSSIQGCGASNNPIRLLTQNTSTSRQHACSKSCAMHAGPVAASRHMRWGYSVSFNFIFRKQVAPTVPVVRSRVPPSALTDRTPQSASAAIQSAFKVGASGRSGAAVTDLSRALPRGIHSGCVLEKNSCARLTS